MLNSYLNGYTEKLSRANANDPGEIHIDEGNYGKILKAVEKKTYNPH